MVNASRCIVIAVSCLSCVMLGRNFFKNFPHNQSGRSSNSIIRPTDEADRIVAHEAANAILAYRDAHHFRYPNAKHWEEQIAPYWQKNRPFTVTLSGKPPRRLAFNQALSGVKSGSPAASDINTVLLFETTSRKKDAFGVAPKRLVAVNGAVKPFGIYLDGHFPDYNE